LDQLQLHALCYASLVRNRRKSSSGTLPKRMSLIKRSTRNPATSSTLGTSRLFLLCLSSCECPLHRKVMNSNKFTRLKRFQTGQIGIENPQRVLMGQFYCWIFHPKLCVVLHNFRLESITRQLIPTSSLLSQPTSSTRCQQFPTPNRSPPRNPYDCLYRPAPIVIRECSDDDSHPTMAYGRDQRSFLD
jgi:hypothetical protein